MVKQLFLSALFLFLIGCSSDDNKAAVVNNPPSDQLTVNVANIAGKWFMKGGSINGGGFQNYVHDCPTLKDYQFFVENGNLDFVGYNDACEISDTETSLWSLNGTTLTVTNLPDAQVLFTYNYTVQGLTNSELILRRSYNEGNGNTIEVTHFTRS